MVAVRPDENTARRLECCHVVVPFPALLYLFLLILTAVEPSMYFIIGLRFQHYFIDSIRFRVGYITPLIKVYVRYLLVVYQSYSSDS